MTETHINYSFFRAIGCCYRCCLRYLNIKEKSSYLDPVSALNQKGINVSVLDEKRKQTKENPCVACLGLLQDPYASQLLEPILRDMSQMSVESTTFNVAISVPSALLLRDLSLDLAQHGPPLNSPFPEPPKGVKDVWKWSFIHKLAIASSLTFDVNSKLMLNIQFNYEDEAKECATLMKMCPQEFSKQNVNKRGFPRKTVEASLKLLSKEIFAKHNKVPPEVPNLPLTCSGLQFNRVPINIAGRYNKWSRELPQTPWVINGERKMESSVQELICDPLQSATKASYARFSSSGREDVDVRTLGTGRPFNVELGNPFRSKFTFEELRKLESEIITNAHGTIHIRDLQIVNKEDLHLLKRGEEEKTKEYSALCVVLGGATVSDEQLSNLEKLCPVTLEQSTPIRVLHRRPVAVRQRTVLSMNCRRSAKDPNKFVLNLTTQAGTYIKEFIHGDFGRTQPSLGELLNGVEVDILALDVMNICLDWPPPVDYNGTQYPPY